MEIVIVVQNKIEHKCKVKLSFKGQVEVIEQGFIHKNEQG